MLTQKKSRKKLVEGIDFKWSHFIDFVSILKKENIEYKYKFEVIEKNKFESSNFYEIYLYKKDYKFIKIKYPELFLR